MTSRGVLSDEEQREKRFWGFTCNGSDDGGDDGLRVALRDSARGVCEGGFARD